jgi:flagellar motor switch protein FliG
VSGGVVSVPGLPSDAPALSGVDKAAVLLLSLDTAACANILRFLPEDDVHALTARMVQMNRVEPTLAESVLQEFHARALTKGAWISGSLDSVHSLLTEAFGREQATRLVDRLSKVLTDGEGDLGNLGKVEPQQLAKFVQDEHPQAIALMVAHLDPSRAAGLLTGLPAELRLEVATRVASLGRVSPESVRTVAGVLQQKLRNLGELSREVSGGVRTVADIFNRLDAATCTELLDALEVSNPALFDNVRRFMFVFEDLLNVDKAALTTLFQQLDRQTIVTALKGSSEELRRYVMSCMSSRAAEMLKEDLEVAGPVKVKVVDAAQQSIITSARELEKQGAISLTSSGAEQYVT